MRVLCFLFRDDRVLLLRRHPQARLFPGQLNALGGHVEPGETPRQAARREVREESGLEMELELVGLVQTPDALLHLFAGEVSADPPGTALEDSLLWLPAHRLPRRGVLPDLQPLLEAVQGARREGQLVYGWSDGHLRPTLHRASPAWRDG